MDSKTFSKLIAGIALTVPAPYVARAETYLTEEQAAQLLFSEIKLNPQWVDLSSEQTARIQSLSGERVLSPRVRVLWGPDREALILDRVIGKHELITYAVAISSEGNIKGIEILDYRETYGYEIRRAPWRKQFVGKTSRDAIQLNRDIQNISGATLSSTHVTDGVRRVLRTYEVLREKV